MARIVKKAEERRSEILQKAQELFYEYGYNKTSVNMIIKSMNISKGAFYHYFSSKENLLDSLADQLSDGIKKKIQSVIENDKFNAIEKLNQVYYESGSFKVKNIDFILAITEGLYSDNNLLLRHKFHNRSLKEFSPLFAKVFKQGIKEGVFNIDKPEIVAKMILLFGFSMSELNAKLILEMKDNPEKLDDLIDNVKIYQYSVERILNAPENSIIAFTEEFFDAFRENIVNSK